MAYVLPYEHQSANRLAFANYDLLQQHIVAGEKAGLLHFEVEVQSDDHATQMAGLEGEELWDWFRDNGYSDALAEHSYRNLVFAFLSDFCQFTYEALKCSEKGKLAVTFANLRKPLQEDLFYLKWLLADREQFLARFRGKPEDFDRTKLAKEPEDRKAMMIDIIGRAMDKTSEDRWVDPESLYDFRYDRSAPHGFDRLFNQALHPVTTFKHNLTDSENINFIFASDETRDSLWDHLYSVLPLMLRHTLNVVRELFRSIDPSFNVVDPVWEIWLAIGFAAPCGSEVYG